ncbi:MAG: ABC transporter permease [Culicoidibacterales bacterium]
MKNNRFARFALIPYALWIVIFVVAPLVLIAYNSFLDIEGHFTFANYGKLLSPVYMKMMFNSFFYSLIVTAVSLLVGYPVAYFISRTKHKGLWLILLILPSWINLLLKTYAFLGILGTAGPINAFLEVIGVGGQQLLFNDFSFVLVSTYIFIPFMILPVYNAIEKINPSLIYASRDLGASNWKTFQRVIFPLTTDGIMSGFQLVFIPTLSLFMITRLIAGNRVITLGTAIEQHFLVTQDWGMGAAIAVVLILVMAIVMFATRKIIK